MNENAIPTTALNLGTARPPAPETQPDPTSDSAAPLRAGDLVWVPAELRANFEEQMALAKEGDRLASEIKERRKKLKAVAEHFETLNAEFWKALRAGQPELEGWHMQLLKTRGAAVLLEPRDPKAASDEQD